MEVKLSVVIITYNEEKNIGRCLAAVADLADDLVVVDSFSKDRTREICEQYGARFMERTFVGHIEQKNFANSQARYPHILSLDADEVLSETLRASIRQVKQHWTADAYRLNRLTNYCGRWVHHSGWYPDRKVRLYKREQAHWGGENPHDKIILTPGAKITQLSGDLLHYSYYTLQEHLNQINLFSEIANREMRRKGKKATIIQLLVKPPFRFFYAYVIRLGVLDGFAGFCIATLSSYAVFVKYAKLYMSNLNDRRP